MSHGVGLSFYLLFIYLFIYPFLSFLPIGWNGRMAWVFLSACLLFIYSFFFFLLKGWVCLSNVRFGWMRLSVCPMLQRIFRIWGNPLILQEVMLGPVWHATGPFQVLRRQGTKKNLFEQYVLIVSYFFFLVLSPSSLILPAPCKYLSPSIASLPANLSHHPHPKPTHSANYSLPPSTLSSFSLPTLCKTTSLS